MELLELDIKLIDSKLLRDKFAGNYIVKDQNSYAIIEVSTAHAVPLILKELKRLKIEISEIKYVFITHIHLDHSSGAGKLLKELPNAKLVVHPSGAKHMAAPEKLISGAIAVYSKEIVEKDYGEILPIPQDRIISCKDGEVFTLNTRELTTIHTPGHARHHISIYDSKSKGIFTGDSFGLSYPELTVEGRRFYQPTTTPTAFEYDKMISSIKKMMDLKPELLFFTHYGFTDNPDEVAQDILKKLKDYKKLIESLDSSDDSSLKILERKLESYYVNECLFHGTTLKEKDIIRLFDIDIKLNAMGLLLWRRKTLDHVL